MDLEIGKGGRFLNMFRRNEKDMPEHAKNRGISLERRLFLYWLIMVLAVMAAVFVVLIVAGVFSNDARKLGGTLSVQQKNTTRTFNKLIDTLNAQNLALSEQISWKQRNGLLKIWIITRS